MSTLPEYRPAPEEYLRIERAAQGKSEYDGGLVLAMAGASLRHNLIVAALIRSLGNRLAERCLVLPSDMKVRVLNPTRFFYPDVSVVCERPQFADDEHDVLLNPLVVVEVLSEATAKYDRGRKFLSYQEIESLQEYVLVSVDQPLVEHFRRDGNHWVYTKTEGLQGLVGLSAVACEVPLHEIYHQIDLEKNDTR